jgi:uncharacterized protein
MEPGIAPQPLLGLCGNGLVAQPTTSAEHTQSDKRNPFILMLPTWLWVLAIVLIVLGVVGTFLPVLPGAALVFAGMLLAAWIDHFQRIGWITVTVLGLLTALVFAIDIIAGFLGAKRVGASRLALVGATIGTIVGLFFGIVGILLGPFLGAVIGELIARGELQPAARVGFGTWLGMAIGALAKIAVVLAMLGVFITSYFVGSGS